MTGHSIGGHKNGEGTSVNNRTRLRRRQRNLVEEEDKVDEREEERDTDDLIPIEDDSNGIDVAFSDIDVLNCYICSEPLSLPIFQVKFFLPSWPIYC